MRKLINSDLDDEQLEIANWIISKPSEIREWGKNEILMFVSHYDVQEFFDLIEKNTYDYFAEGVTELSYNGSDYIVDIYWILKNLDIDWTLIKEARDDD